MGVLQTLKSWLKEPLVHFVLISGGFFLLYGFLHPDEGLEEGNQIIIDGADIERLQLGYQKNWGSLPDSATLAQLIETSVQTEIFYREALRMNLDHNDEIVKRRLQQKYEFLVKDLANTIEPTEEELKTFYQENSTLFQTPKKLSFSQYYFSPDKRKAPLKDAQQVALTLIEKTPDQFQSTSLGDDFHLPNYYAERDFEAIWQQFGRDFADTLFTENQKGWLPPISSGYGIHLVYLSNIQETSILPFDQIKADITEKWKGRQLQVYNDELYKNLRKEYEVVISSR